MDWWITPSHDLTIAELLLWAATFRRMVSTSIMPEEALALLHLAEWYERLASKRGTGAPDVAGVALTVR